MSVWSGWYQCKHCNHDYPEDAMHDQDWCLDCYDEYKRQVGEDDAKEALSVDQPGEQQSVPENRERGRDT